MPAIEKGTYGIALDQLRTMLAMSKTFVLAAGGTERAAHSRVHLGRQVGSPPRPFAVIEMTDGAANAVGTGSRNVLLASGSMQVLFERDADLTAADPYHDAVDWFSRVVDEVNLLAADGHVATKFGQTHLPLLTVSLRGVGENDRGAWHSLGRFHSAVTVWTWGDA